jgi:hypothetical protein
MANHCYNHVSFSGSHEGLEKLASRIKLVVTEADNIDAFKLNHNYLGLSGYNYHRILGTKKKNLSLVSHKDVYQEYGSKWFECNYEIYEKAGVFGAIDLSGDSAWSPMIPFIAKICKKFKLEAEGFYEESGMDFAGDYIIDSNGNIEENQMTYKEYQAKDNPEGYWENLMDDIQEGSYETLAEIYKTLETHKFHLTEEDVKVIDDEFTKYKEANSK